MIKLFVFGRLKEPHFRLAAEEYIKRLGGLCRLSVRELEPAFLPQNPSEAQIRATLEKEGEALLAVLPPRGKVCALCVEGKAVSTEDFALRLEELEQNGGVSFVIGSSFGLAEAVKQRADWRLSLSPMTLPHELARVVLLEQLYRARMISAGRKYHK
ncbi:MAG: 23S rRNA (pseudouridine(1915)-N(3))-methyltransferase RlmH [Clostridium sp.]|nr:23S rRNA (pseudouridine(1915)-N(3))-methyltransferase RlmH [Clostridium sp.]